MRAVVGPADPAMPVERDSPGLAADPRQDAERGLDGRMGRPIPFERLHDTGGEQGPGDALTVAGEGHAPNCIVGIEATARQRRVPDPTWKGAIESPGRGARRDPPGL